MSWANDNLANATAISGASGSITPLAYDGTVDPATSESGEDLYGTGETLWWKWTAPSTQDFIFSTAGSPSAPATSTGLDTKLQVFSGPSSSPTHASLTRRGFNDDQGGSDPYTYNSKVTFSATAGTTYYIQVDQFGTGQAGTLHLSWLAVPPPAPTLTSLSDSTVKVGGSVTLFGTNLGAVTTVYFGTAAVTSFTIVSSTQITVTVPTDATPSGSITVSNGSLSSALSFTPLFPGPWEQQVIYGPTDHDVAGGWTRSNRSWTATTADEFITGPDGSTDDTIGTGTAQFVYDPGSTPPFMVQGTGLLDIEPWWTDPTTGPTNALVRAMPYQPDIDDLPTGAYEYEYEHAPDPSAAGTFDGAYLLYLWKDVQVASSRGLDPFRVPTSEYTQGTIGTTPGIANRWFFPDDLATFGPLPDTVTDVTGTDIAYGYGIDAADLDDGYRFAVVAADLDYEASELSPPTNVGVYIIRPAFRYRPDRHRFFYDTPQTTAVHTLRRRQQAAPTGGAPRRRQIGSRVGNLRRGPGAAP